MTDTETRQERVRYWADLLRPILTDTQEVVDLAGVPALLDYKGTEGAEPHSYECMPSATELEGPAADKDRVIELLFELADHYVALLDSLEATP